MNDYVIIYYRDLPPQTIDIPQDYLAAHRHLVSLVKAEPVEKMELYLDNALASTYNGYTMKWTRTEGATA
jgi:hypothetical protein